MGGSKSTSTPSGHSGLPDWAQPYISGGMETAQNAYNGGFGTTASNMGSDIYGAGGDLLQQILGGQFLDPSTNPWLQSTFDTAAQSTQNRLSSEFAGSGRNVGASYPARSEELQGLASSIFGGAYQQERSLMNQALGFAPSFAQGGLDFEQDPLNNYLNQLMGLGQASQQAETFDTSHSNPWSGALGGAASGAALGSVVPGLGTGVGAGIGGLIGFFGG